MLVVLAYLMLHQFLLQHLLLVALHVLLPVHVTSVATTLHCSYDMLFHITY